MPIFKIEIFKHVGGENWANSYLVQAPVLVAASGYAAEIAELEQSFHYTPVQFDYIRTSTLAPGDSSYTTTPLGTAGEVSLGVSALAPLWVTARADIEVNAGGAPSRKFYRGALVQSDYDFDSVSTTVRSSIAAVLQSMIDGGEGVGVVPFVDPQGQAWVNATVYGLPQMRQLHRKRRYPVAP